jgi:hypothetical protein
MAGAIKLARSTIINERICPNKPDDSDLLQENFDRSDSSSISLLGEKSICISVGCSLLLAPASTTTVSTTLQYQACPLLFPFFTF